MESLILFLNHIIYRSHNNVVSTSDLLCIELYKYIEYKTRLTFTTKPN